MPEFLEERTARRRMEKRGLRTFPVGWQKELATLLYEQAKSQDDGAGRNIRINIDNSVENGVLSESLSIALKRNMDEESVIYFWETDKLGEDYPRFATVYCARCPRGESIKYALGIKIRHGQFVFVLTKEEGYLRMVSEGKRPFYSFEDAELDLKALRNEKITLALEKMLGD